MTDRIVVDPKIMLGKPVIRGTRITVEIILEKLATGQKMKEIMRDYPRLKEADIRAVLAFASKTVRKLEPPKYAQSTLHNTPR